MKLASGIFCGIAFAVSFGTNTLANEARSLQFGDGNKLTIDQSMASDSFVGGVELNMSQLSDPLLGIDSIFEATRGPLTQDSRGGNSANGNNATVTVESEAGIALMMQIGFENTGTIDLSGNMARGSLLQIGNDNNGSVKVSGSGAGVLHQVGDNNIAALEVDNVNVLYKQIGNNLAASNPVTVSNYGGAGGQISMTQY